MSGDKALDIASSITGIKLQPRLATYVDFLNAEKQTIDSGLVLYFSAPNSFTGEHVVELQGHGGPVILQLLLQRVLELGARAARPGEFSERAFLNDKIDLAQAEAIADLIDSSSTAAAQSAVRSLQGEFSAAIQQLLTQLIEIRMYVESAIDFPEEEIDFLSDGVVLGKIEHLQKQVTTVKQQAGQGQLLQHGFRLALAGKPNAGKSSLLNALSGQEAAIVTDVAGTTRDSITVTVTIDGLPVHITDTAGLRQSDDKVERIGIERARRTIKQSDHVLLLVDATQQEQIDEILQQEELDQLGKEKLTVVLNKQDLLEQMPQSKSVLYISATQGSGLSELREEIKRLAGYQSDDSNVFSARARHLMAIDQAEQAIQIGKNHLLQTQAGELLAEELLQAQQALNSITGEFTSDDLLGEIFSSFCIGK